MQFLYPGFLFALAAIAIPIIIHLFNFRRFKKIYFTNVRFLREIRQDTQSRSKLRHLLILISRILAVIFLVLAFAQPYIPLEGRNIVAGTKEISIYVDNSFSMDAEGRTGNLLETARKKAREIAMAYKPSDRFQLLTTDFEARHQRLVSREEFLQLLDEVQPGSATRMLSEVMQRQQEALNAGNEDGITRSYIVSDFQKSVTDQPGVTDTSIRYSLVPVSSSGRNNLYIDTCFLSTPFVQLNVPNELTVVIRNNGSGSAVNIPLRLTINGVQKAIATVSVAGGSSGEARLSFTLFEPGWQQAVVNITDHPVTFDDNFYFSFNVRRNINILCINGQEPGQSINAVFANDDYFQLRNSQIGQIDYSAFPSTQLIILNEVSSFSSGMIQEIEKYINKGGSVFVIPAEDAELSSYNELLSVLGLDSYSQQVIIADKVVSIESGSSLFTNVFDKAKGIPENMDLPVVNRFYPFIRRAKSNAQTIMKLQSGSAYLIETSSGSYKGYALASSLKNDASGLPRHALFVPIFIRAALHGSSEIVSPLIIGRDHDFIVGDTVLANDHVFHLVNESLGFDIIPESRLIRTRTVVSVHDQVDVAQNYKLNSGDKLVSSISFNYDRAESDLTAFIKDELEKIASQPGATNIEVIEQEGKDLSHAIAQMNEGKRLWKFCIIAALLFLAAEVLLIRFFNRSTVPA